MDTQATKSKTGFPISFNYVFLRVKKRCYHINYDVIQGFPALRKVVTAHAKKNDISFTCVWYRQLAADTSLAFRVTRSGWWMNGKAFVISIYDSLSEFFRIMAAKTLKNPYRLQTGLGLGQSLPMSITLTVRVACWDHLCTRSAVFELFFFYLKKITSMLAYREWYVARTNHIV